jgi:Rod binding domain-containing protein
MSSPVALPPSLLGVDDGALDGLRRRPESARPEAAKQVEVLFLTQLIRAMRKTVPENDFLPRSPARDVYEGAFDRAVAQAMAERDPLGLVDRLAGPPLKNPAESADTAVGNQDSGRNNRP